MREFEFIHADEDVADVLKVATDFGLSIRRDKPSREAVPDIVDSMTISGVKDGMFMAYLPTWIFGEFKYNLIEGGYRKGLYSQMPSTNCIDLHFYFRKECRENQFTRLGDGFMSRDIQWYRPQDHTVHPAPPDVKSMFDKIRKTIDSGKYIDVGGRRYTILRGALRKLASGSYRPPFDFMDGQPIQGLELR